MILCEIPFWHHELHAWLKTLSSGILVLKRNCDLPLFDMEIECLIFESQLAEVDLVAIELVINLISQSSTDQVMSGWVCLLLHVHISLSVLFDVDHNTVKQSVEPLGEFKWTLHGVVSEHIESEFTCSKRTVSLVMDRQIDLEFEGVEVESLYSIS